MIGWAFVVVGIAGLVGDLWPLLTPAAAQQWARLRADGILYLGPAWTLRLAAIVAGAWLLRGHNWARWLLVAWMAIHVGISVFHSWQEVLMHTAIFALVIYVLFRDSSGRHFRAPGVPQPGRELVE